MSIPQLDFASVLASSIHDMKNSLGGLIGGLEELHDKLAQEDQDQVGLLKHQSQRLNIQLMRMLSIYKLQQGVFKPNLDWHSTTELLQDAADAHAPLLEARGVSIELDQMTQQQDLTISCDRELVLNVLDNALTNAYRYACDCVELSARSWSHDSGEGVVLRVRDDGCGFPEDFQVSALMRKAQEPNRHSGTGLGLYFSELVAQLHVNRGVHGYLACNNNGIHGGAATELFIP